MVESHNSFFALLRFSLGIDRDFNFRPTIDEWKQLYNQTLKQSLVGVTYEGVSQLPEDYFESPASDGADSQAAYMPQWLAMQWANDAEIIAGLNEQLNSKAAQLTTRFEQQGHHTVILKGQANALLYPNPLSRQPGDIDIYVDGGRERVEATLRRLGMADDADGTTTTHHFHLPPDGDGIEVEVHHKPSSGNLNATTNQRLQAYLMQLLADGGKLTDARFRVPSSIFALTMQLAHISRHIMEGGLGLRQIIDYYFLLRSSTDDDRRQLAARLKKLGLHHVAAALMWLLAETLHLPKELMLTAPDRRRGRWLLNRVLDGGNFGWYTTPMPRYGARQRFVIGRRQSFGLIWFCPQEAHQIMRKELKYWLTLFVTIPQRIWYRKLSLNGV